MSVCVCVCMYVCICACVCDPQTHTHTHTLSFLPLTTALFSSPTLTRHLPKVEKNVVRPEHEQRDTNWTAKLKGLGTIHNALVRAALLRRSICHAVHRGLDGLRTSSLGRVLRCGHVSLLITGHTARNAVGREGASAGYFRHAYSCEQLQLNTLISTHSTWCWP